MFCITDFDLQPFRSIVELSLVKKHNQIEAVKDANKKKSGGKPLHICTHKTPTYRFKMRKGVKKYFTRKSSTRKSSSRVSRKTRRHKRTSR